MPASARSDRCRGGDDIRSGQDAWPLVAREQGALLRGPATQDATRSARWADRAAEVPDDRVAARSASRLSARGAATPARAPRARRAPSCRSSIIKRRMPPRRPGRPDSPPCAVLTIDGLGDGLSATHLGFRDGRSSASPHRPRATSLGVFFEHVTNLLNMRELEDEGKVMALADYAAPIADDDNPMLPLGARRDGVIETDLAWARAASGRWRAVHWRFANEQFAYLAQRTVETCCDGAGP